MRGYNSVELIGNVTSDVECKVSKSGTEYARFSLAINNSYKDKAGNKVDTVTYVNLVAFGQTAKIAGNYLRKGAPAFIKGSIQVSKKTNEAGESRTETNVKVDELILLSSAGGRGQVKPDETLDSYFPESGAPTNAGGEYSNRPFPQRNADAVPQSLREEFMGIDPAMDFPFGANV